MATLITHLIALIVGGGGGYYLHYKLGSKLAAEANVIKSAVNKL
ncbi:MAG: hypothetical protein ACREQ5_03805 [Candidatus Dormibacteria bacterium]